uniref:C2H2-type domain-containing protein n=1 Tax=Tetranychus urticae TaxID=32264 RepID=T1JZN0_TETUR
MNSIVSHKIKNHGAKPYRSERVARKSTSEQKLVTSLPTFNKISTTGGMTFECRFFDCKYIFTQHHKLIVHQTLTHGLIECEKCSVAYFTKSEKYNCFAKHESQKTAESTITEDTVDQEGELQHVIEGILEAEEENLVTLAPYLTPNDSPQLTSIQSTSQQSCSLVQKQAKLPTLSMILKRFKCQKTECGRLFENEWALKSHFCAIDNYKIPKITRLDSEPNIIKNCVKSKKAKSVETVEVYSTDSSSDGDTDEVEKDITWFPGLCSNKRPSRKLRKENRNE